MAPSSSPATIADAATARATAMPVLAGVLDAIAAGYCHQLGRWDEADELLGNLDPHRLDGIVQLVVAALLDIDRGDVDRAGDRLELVRANTLGLRDGRLDGLLFRGLAERAWSRGHLGAVAAIVDEGMQRTTDQEMIAWLALVGLRAADGAGTDGNVDRWIETLGDLADYADRRRLGTGRRAALGGGDRGGRTDLDCAVAADPERLGVSSRRVGSDGLPATCRLLRLAPGRGGAGRWRSTATKPPPCSRAPALQPLDLGARPLAAAIEQSARRARVAVAQSRPPSRHPPAAPMTTSGSPPASSRCSSCSPAAGPTSRSPSRCSSARRPPGCTCPTCSPSWRCRPRRGGRCRPPPGLLEHR